MDWMLMPLRRYAEFSGRSRRKEYWMFVLGTFILYLIMGAIAGLAGVFNSYTMPGEFSGTTMVALALFAIVALGLFIPSLAVQIRRFHDQDRSGWWWLLSFVPYIGALIVLVFMCIEGTRGENRFGPDPKAGAID